MNRSKHGKNRRDNRRKKRTKKDTNQAIQELLGKTRETLSYTDRIYKEKKKERYGILFTIFPLNLLLQTKPDSWIHYKGDILWFHQARYGFCSSHHKVTA